MIRNVCQIAAGVLLGISSIAARAAGEVQLISARSSDCSMVPGCTGGNLTARIEVKNIAYVKQVGIRYKTSAGTWVSAPAQYFMPTTPGKELWSISLPGPSEAFAVYYTVNGVTYWDNNGGQNYRTSLTGRDAVLGSPMIGDAQGGWTFVAGDKGELYGDLLVRKTGSSRAVTAVYTEDNWLTTKVAQASFKQTFPSGIESWSFKLPTAAQITPSRIQIAFHYTWKDSAGNSRSAWDNSYGRNYGLHSQMFIAPR